MKMWRDAEAADANAWRNEVLQKVQVNSHAICTIGCGVHEGNEYDAARNENAAK